MKLIPGFLVEPYQIPRNLQLRLCMIRPNVLLNGRFMAAGRRACMSTVSKKKNKGAKLTSGSGDKVKGAFGLNHR